MDAIFGTKMSLNKIDIYIYILCIWAMSEPLAWAYVAFNFTFKCTKTI